MNESVYKPPQTNIEKASSIEVPEAILKKIKHCWIAGLISIGITVFFTLLSLSGANILGLDAWAFIDIAILSGLVYGVIRKSRICAVLLFAFFLLNKLLMFQDTGAISGLPVALIFLWFYGQGIVGTFQYHKYIRENAA